jgi:putative membrane protein
MVSRSSTGEHDVPETPARDVPRFDVKAEVTTHFAWIRTRLALERTMMAWLRTAVSMIGFGFTMFQVLVHLGHTRGVKPAVLPEAPRYLCLALIGAGVIACAISLRQYYSATHYLCSPDFSKVAGMGEKPAHTMVQPLAAFLLLVGVFAFLAVLLRVD